MFSQRLLVFRRLNVVINFNIHSKYWGHSISFFSYGAFCFEDIPFLG